MRRRSLVSAALVAALLLGSAGCSADATPSSPISATRSSPSIPDSPLGGVAPEVDAGDGNQAGVDLTTIGDAPTTAATGEEFAPINVQLLDGSGAPVSGSQITFSTTSGATFAEGVFATTTDETGVATAYGLKAGDVVGDFVVSVATGNLVLDIVLTVT